MTFWQGALRDDTEEVHRVISESIVDGSLTVELAYLDHEGGQRTFSRFGLIRSEDDGEWWVTLSRHHIADSD